MTLTELIAEVYNVTGRPDRVAETLSAIRSATLKMHQTDRYLKDIFECVIGFSSAEYIQNWDYIQTIPRWREPKYLRKIDYLNNIPGKLLTKLVPEQIFDGYTVEKDDVYYVAGAYVQIKSSTQEQYYLHGCYLNPNITADGFDSWVARDHPFAIIYDAAATVFKAIGKDEEASSFRNLVNDQITLIRQVNIDDGGSV